MAVSDQHQTPVYINRKVLIEKEARWASLVAVNSLLLFSIPCRENKDYMFQHWYRPVIFGLCSSKDKSFAGNLYLSGLTLPLNKICKYNLNNFK